MASSLYYHKVHANAISISIYKAEYKYVAEKINYSACMANEVMMV